MEKMSTLTFPDGSQYEVVDVAARAQASVNAEDITELNQKTDNINVYVGEDKKLHFVDSAGADTVLPFKASDYIYLIKDGKAQSDTGVNFNLENLKEGDGYLQPTLTTIASGRVNLLSLDLSKYKGIVADMDSNEGATLATYWYIGGTNAHGGSRQSFASAGYTGIKNVTFACKNTVCHLYNLYLIPA